MKVAAVDIGTNTVRLLLAEATGDASGVELTDVVRHEVITKLGEGLDGSGRLSDEPMNRALAGLERYAALIAESGAVVMGGVATAATRSAANGAQFANRVAATLGFHPRIIDGVEEGRLTFLGAISGREKDEAYCVIDVGGGSTEFVMGVDFPEYAVSIDIGSVRLTERIASVPLRDPASIRAHVDDLFADVVAPFSPGCVLGSGGTFVTLGAVARGLTTTAVEEIGPVLAFDEVVDTVDRLLAMTVDEIAALPAVPAARAAVLQAGVVCAERAIAHIGGGDVRISVSDILDGLAMELATQQWPGTETPGHWIS